MNVFSYSDPVRFSNPTKPVRFGSVTPEVEQSLMIIKPDVSGKEGILPTILKRLGRKDLHVIQLKRIKQLTREQAEKFYEEHQKKPFYQKLIEFMRSGPVVVMQVQGKNAIRIIRKLIGSTNSENAAPGTIRDQFGTDITRNAVHASDSPENAKKEIEFFFSNHSV